jgi:hypothetical protein
MIQVKPLGERGCANFHSSRWGQLLFNDQEWAKHAANIVKTPKRLGLRWKMVYLGRHGSRNREAMNRRFRG